MVNTAVISKSQRWAHRITKHHLACICIKPYEIIIGV